MLIVLIKIDVALTFTSSAVTNKSGVRQMSGLDGVVAADTVLSLVDGQAGQLILRGARVEDLAGQVTFEALLVRLWEDFFPDLPATLEASLGFARAEVFKRVEPLDSTILSLDPVEALRALLARLPDGDDLRTALHLVAAPAVFTAAIMRARVGQDPVAPDPSLRHAQDSLRMLRGSPASESECEALDAYLVTVSDHGFNASTFAARVAASTRAGLTSATIAGLCALKGPLHGGAPGPIIAMLDEIGSPDRAKAWINSALDRGERMMGFGHRIYQVRDPRADALKRAVRRLAEGSDSLPGRLAFAEAVESAVLEVLQERKPDRSLQTNVEFFTALLLESLGISPSAFTCIFCMGRVGGWIGHAREQVQTGRLIRPESHYVGPMPRI
jgi:citrate synthase